MRRRTIKIPSTARAKYENAMARLRREAALGIRLAHHYVCHIGRIGETEDSLVKVVMPYVELGNLSDLSHRVEITSLPDVAKFTTEIADGLHVAHRIGTMDRDLQPENIMIREKPDGTEFAVVMDFGLARERQAEAYMQKLTATGIILGTAEFMRLELLRGRPLDPRTNICSLALVTYGMLMAKLRFESRNQQEMMIARIRAEPIPARYRREEGA